MARISNHESGALEIIHENYRAEVSGTIYPCFWNSPDIRQPDMQLVHFLTEFYFFSLIYTFPVNFHSISQYIFVILRGILPSLVGFACSPPQPSPGIEDRML